MYMPQREEKKQTKHGECRGAPTGKQAVARSQTPIAAFSDPVRSDFVLIAPQVPELFDSFERIEYFYISVGFT